MTNNNYICFNNAVDKIETINAPLAQKMRSLPESLKQAIEPTLCGKISFRQSFCMSTAEKEYLADFIKDKIEYYAMYYPFFEGDFMKVRGLTEVVFIVDEDTILPAVGAENTVLALQACFAVRFISNTHIIGYKTTADSVKYLFYKYCDDNNIELMTPQYLSVFGAEQWQENFAKLEPAVYEKFQRSLEEEMCSGGYGIRWGIDRKLGAIIVRRDMPYKLTPKQIDKLYDFMHYHGAIKGVFNETSILCASVKAH